MRAVGTFAGHCHHDHRHTEQSHEQRDFNRHVDHHGRRPRLLDPTGDERHPRPQAVVVMRNPMQCTIRRWFCGSRTWHRHAEAQGWSRTDAASGCQATSSDHRMAKLGADADGPVEMTGAVVVNVVTDHGASHFDRRSSCDRGRGMRSPSPRPNSRRRRAGEHRFGRATGLPVFRRPWLRRRLAGRVGRCCGDTISGIPPQANATTGVPHDIASATTSPYGSCHTGVTSAAAERPTKRASSSWLRCPA